MAVAELIGAAVGMLLLIIVAYIVVGSTLTAAETVSYAQKDLTQLNEARLRTGITLTGANLSGQGLNFSIVNSGGEIIRDFSHMDILLSTGGESSGYQHLNYDSGSCGVPGTWCIYGDLVPDTIHPRELDPGEKMWIWATYTTGSPEWFQVSTGNGVYATAYI
jgi:flagellar protein FlaF